MFWKIGLRSTRDFRKHNGGLFYKVLVKTLKKDDKMTTPRPDQCIGIRGDKFAAGEDTLLDGVIIDAIRI